ncbi:hypothetical protein [Lelliottia sp. T2.26D-8]|uniref:hypothetical protein n=1 Tax=Lelliottia sp. T2.26D-8 TaxID=3041165 RepID=UPI002477B83D|nr:hypothetical protein [Lelliottia sp. T2.26D-8]CAI9399461.1 hypothetical protein CCAJJPOJ_00222 [Lelliottia sp. T2.26D-8]
MKLIDILVQELPNRGGWPIDSDDERTLTATLPGICWGLDGGGYYAFRGPCDSVSHQLYEETLLARKSVWNGEGLPPVGAECEFYDCEAWHVVQVKFIGDKYAVLQDLKFDVERVYCVADKPDKFRPIRSEADKKRDEAATCIQEMFDSYNEDVGNDELSRFGYRLLQKIAAGKIPHIRID